MNIIILLIGVGIGFFIAALLLFWVIKTVGDDNKKPLAQVAKTNETLISQQREIMLATQRIANALEAKNKNQQ